MSGKFKTINTYEFSKEWKDAPIHFSWNGTTFYSVNEAKKTLKSLKDAIKQAKKSKKSKK